MGAIALTCQGPLTQLLKEWIRSPKQKHSFIIESMIKFFDSQDVSTFALINHAWKKEISDRSLNYLVRAQYLIRNSKGDPITSNFLRRLCKLEKVTGKCFMRLSKIHYFSFSYDEHEKIHWLKKLIDQIPDGGKIVPFPPTDQSRLCYENPHLNKEMHRIQQFSGLSVVNLFLSKEMIDKQIQDDGFAQLKDLKSLRHLKIEGDRVGVEELVFNAAHISELTKLQSLSIQNNIQIIGLETLKGLSKLKWLSITNCPKTDFTPIKYLTGLQHLSFRCIKITDSELLGFKTLTSLQKFVVFGWKGEYTAVLMDLTQHLGLIHSNQGYAVHFKNGIRHSCKITVFCKKYLKSSLMSAEPTKTS